jgi:hypothetical protein
VVPLMFGTYPSELAALIFGGAWLQPSGADPGLVKVVKTTRSVQADLVVNSCDSTETGAPCWAPGRDVGATGGMV